MYYSSEQLISNLHWYKNELIEDCEQGRYTREKLFAERDRVFSGFEDMADQGYITRVTLIALKLHFSRLFAQVQPLALNVSML